MKKITVVLVVLMLVASFISCDNNAPTIVVGEGASFNGINVNESSFEDMIATRPTKEGYVFAGWYSDALYNDYINPSAITSEQKKQKRAYAKWITVEESVTYSVRSAEITVNDSGRDKQPLDCVSISNNYNLLDLQRAGYRSLKVTVTLEISEKNDGYQYIFLYKNKNCNSNDVSLDSLWDQYIKGEDDSDPNCLYGYRHEHTAGKVDTSWATVTFEKTVMLSDLKDDLYLRYGASGKDEDTWYNKNVVVTVTPIK